MGHASFHTLSQAFFPRNRSHHRRASVVPEVLGLRKRHQLLRFRFLLCWMLLTVGVGMVVPHQVARAASPAFPPGYSLTVTESVDTMIYGGANAPTIQAQLTVPAGEHPAGNPALFNFVIGSQNYGADTSAFDGSTYTFTLKSRSLSGISSPPAGQQTVVASYYSVPLKQTLQSAPITLTVQKDTLFDVQCPLFGGSPQGVNAPLTFQFNASSGSGLAIPWQEATYTITFMGPQTFTETNLTADSTGQGTVVTPPVPGRYTYQCTFNGTQNYNAAIGTFGTTLIVSANHPTTIKFYTNPTTVKAGQYTILEIVVSGAPGLPAPTGSVNMYLGGYTYSNNITLGSNGSVVVDTTFPSPLPSDFIQVGYSGDTVYASSVAKFSLTNPPLPGGGPQPTPVPISTSTVTPTSTSPVGSTPVPSSTAIANRGTTSGTTSGSHPTNPTSRSGDLVFWAVVPGGLLLLAALGSGIFLARRKRARAAPTSPTATFPFSEEDV